MTRAYEGKIAVVTGAASGIGLGIARRAGAEGMIVVLADVDVDALEQARAALAGQHLSVHAFPVDVSDATSVTSLADRVKADVGPVSLLVNNAGVFVASPFLQMSAAEWSFVLGVNLWGVVNGLQAFLPDMVERGEGHVVNTASVEGLVTVQNAAGYVASKHAVVGLSEVIFRELQQAGSAVGISVLCPGAVATDILRSARHWPGRLGSAPAVPTEDYPELDEVMEPSAVADIVFDAVAERRFWVLTHPAQYGAAIRARADGIVRGADPDDTTVDPNFRREAGRLPK